MFYSDNLSYSVFVLISGKNIRYIVDDHGHYYTITACITMTKSKMINNLEFMSDLKFDEADTRKQLEIELEQKIFDDVYGDLYAPVRRTKWWISKNCPNNLLLLDGLNVFNDILDLLKMKI